MQLFRTLASLQRGAGNPQRVVTIGVFDGLHLGHQAILEETKARAAATGRRTCVCSFEPMPAEYFAPNDPPPRLTRFRERFERIDALGIDELFCARFRTIRGLSPRAFIDELLVSGLNTRHVVIGDDFRFGADRRGSAEALREAGKRCGFGVTEVAPVFLNGRRVSSTAIREALKSGDLGSAKGMLGRDYSISGRVIRGLGLGKSLGFPTANVNLKRLHAPVDGIFAARVSGLGARLFDGVASVGTRPTVGGGKALLEVFVFDFDRDIYDRYITVHFVERLREERHFQNLAAMKEQMRLDVQRARAALAA